MFNSICMFSGETRLEFIFPNAQEKFFGTRFSAF